ncbi:putative membrane protein, partial [Chlamydia psittaci 84-8471/1]
LLFLSSLLPLSSLSTSCTFALLFILLLFSSSPLLLFCLTCTHSSLLQLFSLPACFSYLHPHFFFSSSSALLSYLCLFFSAFALVLLSVCLTFILSSPQDG